MKKQEAEAMNVLIDKVNDVTSDFTMQYDDSDSKHSTDSLPYKYACLLDELNVFISNLVDEANKE